MEMSKLTSQIDYKSLETELQKALEADKLYRLQNSAKFRAIEQNVPTYEDFRKMVNAAHLKPLQRVDVTSKATGSWNSVINNNDSSITTAFAEFNRKECNGNSNSNVRKNTLPSTYEQFIQIWKTIKEYKAKFNYLRSLRNILQEKVFRREICPTLFAELINVCFEIVTTEDSIEPIVEILSILSKCNRFHLTICFMKRNEKETCTRLFRDLLAKTECQDEFLRNDIKSLGLSYGIALE